MDRTKKGQEEHDREVRKLAKEYEKKGYDVQADVHGWEKPDTIRGVRPDLLVSKKGHKTAVEGRNARLSRHSQGFGTKKSTQELEQGRPTEALQKNHHRRMTVIIT